jgi:tellurite resistance protein TehA-like permease
MAKHYIGHEFEALKLRYEDQVCLLRRITESENKLFLAFIGFQLSAFVWVAKSASLDDCLSGVVLIFANVALSLLLFLFLLRNYERRNEVIATVRNINEALGFTAIGVYLPEKTLNPEYRAIKFPVLYQSSVAISCLIFCLVVVLRFCN